MFIISVRYLREVTPYFRKATIISEVGWELQRGFLSSNPPIHRSPQKSDTRYLPLQLCCLTRNYKHSDPGILLIGFFIVTQNFEFYLYLYKFQRIKQLNYIHLMVYIVVY